MLRGFFIALAGEPPTTGAKSRTTTPSLPPAGDNERSRLSWLGQWAQTPSGGLEELGAVGGAGAGGGKWSDSVLASVLAVPLA